MDCVSASDTLNGARSWLNSGLPCEEGQTVPHATFIQYHLNSVSGSVWDGIVRPRPFENVEGHTI